MTFKTRIEQALAVVERWLLFGGGHFFCLFILTQHKSHVFKNSSWTFTKESIPILKSQ